jgi:hypothetical protein
MLPTPTVELVEAECRAFDLDPFNQLGDKALKELLEQFSLNVVSSYVLLKVLALNKLYSTRIRDIDVEPLARHIAAIGIDPLLNQGSLIAVERIFMCPELRRKYYSFATKFCSWHKPESYPLYDSYAVECLWTYKKQDSFHRFHRQDLWYYEKLVATVTAFRHWYKLDGLTFRQIDKFLWRSGYKILQKTD